MKPNKSKIAVRLLLVCLLISLVFNSVQLAILSKRLEDIRKASPQIIVKHEHTWTPVNNANTIRIRISAYEMLMREAYRHHKRRRCVNQEVRPIQAEELYK